MGIVLPLSKAIGRGRKFSPVSSAGSSGVLSPVAVMPYDLWSPLWSDTSLIWRLNAGVWTQVVDAVALGDRITIHPRFLRHLYRTSFLAGNGAVASYLYSANYGDTWTVMTVAAGQNVIEVVGDPVAASTLWAITRDGANVSIYRSINDGTTWTQLNTSLGERISGLVVSPNGLSIYYCTSRVATNLNYLYRSTDGGTTWGVVDTYTPVISFPGAVVIDKNNPNRVIWSIFRNIVVNFRESINNGGLFADLVTTIRSSTLASLPNGTIFAVSFADGSLWSSNGNNVVFTQLGVLPNNDTVNRFNYVAPSISLSYPNRVYVLNENCSAADTPIVPRIINRVYYSDDSGSNWTLLDHQNERDLRNIVGR